MSVSAPWFAVTLAAATAALSTLGAASATGPPSSDPLQQAAFEYAQCLRDNGIEDYPDPHIGEGGGVMIASPLDVTTAGNEEVAAAQAACQHILEEAGPLRHCPRRLHAGRCHTKWIETRWRVGVGQDRARR